MMKFVSHQRYSESEYLWSHGEFSTYYLFLAKENSSLYLPKYYKEVELSEEEREELGKEIGIVIPADSRIFEVYDRYHIPKDVSVLAKDYIKLLDLSIDLLKPEEKVLGPKKGLRYYPDPND